jgi:uncharacterized RDD family membrane protein YckC
MADEHPEEPGATGLPRYPGTAPPPYPGSGETGRPADDWYTQPPQPGSYYPPGSTPPPRTGWGSSYPGGPPGATPPYAGYWSRVGGAVIDAIIISVVSLIYLVPAHAFSTHRAANGHVAGIARGGAIVVIIIGALYAAFLIGLRGQTLGMMAMRIKAVDANSGELIGFGKALGRDLLERLFSILFVIPLIIDLLFPLWDPRHQTLHDKAVNSVVIRA